MKTIRLGPVAGEIRRIVNSIDGYVEEIASAASSEMPLVVCGGHPVHAGKLKRLKVPTACL